MGEIEICGFWNSRDCRLFARTKPKTILFYFFLFLTKGLSSIVIVIERLNARTSILHSQKHGHQTKCRDIEKCTISNSRAGEESVSQQSKNNVQSITQ